MDITSILKYLNASSLESNKDFLTSFLPFLNRLKLWRSILRRSQEEEILSIVPISPTWLDSERSRFLVDQSLEEVCLANNWTPHDLDVHLSLPEALRLYAEYSFGPGLEDQFLTANGGHDQVIYSVIRVHDLSLAQELWIRIEEGEKSFSDLASEFGEGPESSKKGLLGPVPLGSIQPPQLQTLLRSLSVSKVSHPTQLGEWIILVRLEQLTKARFDDKMRS